MLPLELSEKRVVGLLHRLSRRPHRREDDGLLSRVFELSLENVEREGHRESQCDDGMAER
jgi:hypothetical protein